MCHRIRAMLDNDQFPKLMGEVEADETFIGGKDKNSHWNKRSHSQGGFTTNKTMVIGAISRKGNVVCKMIEEAGFDTLNKFVREAVSEKVTLLATDENPGYRHVSKEGYLHDTVNHSQHEYVRGGIHTNSIENFWSLLKRGIVGTYHNVSKKYLPLYLNEFQWRFNNPKNPDIFMTAIAGC
jgi:transposase-like protein